MDLRYKYSYTQENLITPCFMHLVEKNESEKGEKNCSGGSQLKLQNHYIIYSKIGYEGRKQKYFSNDTSSKPELLTMEGAQGTAASRRSRTDGHGTYGNLYDVVNDREDQNPTELIGRRYLFISFGQSFIQTSEYMSSSSS